MHRNEPKVNSANALLPEVEFVLVGQRPGRLAVINDDCVIAGGEGSCDADRAAKIKLACLQMVNPAPARVRVGADRVRKMEWGLTVFYDDCVFTCGIGALHCK
jgi:hypothetical protein